MKAESFEEKFTPGPWNRGYGNFIYQGKRYVESKSQQHIATFHPPNGTKEELEVAFANTRLAASSPDLLKACKAALECLNIGKLASKEEVLNAKTLCENAICKAIGPYYCED